MIGKIRDMLTFEGLAYACYDYPGHGRGHGGDLLPAGGGFPRPGAAADRFRLCQRLGGYLLQERPDRVGGFLQERGHAALQAHQQEAHAHGIDLWYTDCDGDVRPILPYFLEGGINCLFPFEVNGCAHPAELAERIRQGPADHGRRGQDRAGQRQGGDQGIPGNPGAAGGARRLYPVLRPPLPAECKLEDYLYYLDLKEKMFGMK